MGAIEDQFERLKDQFPGAELRRLPSGACLITVPYPNLPPGWSKTATNIYFVAPAGYPFAKPDCFWADPDLRLAGPPLKMPQASNMTPLPEVQPPTPLLWFSWHVAQWFPNKDSLLTYFRVILNRFQALQ